MVKTYILVALIGGNAFHIDHDLSATDCADRATVNRVQWVETSHGRFDIPPDAPLYCVPTPDPAPTAQSSPDAARRAAEATQAERTLSGAPHVQSGYSSGLWHAPDDRRAVRHRSSRR